jgi:hypothetical protein
MRFYGVEDILEREERCRRAVANLARTGVPAWSEGASVIGVLKDGSGYRIFAKSIGAKGTLNIAEFCPLSRRSVKLAYWEAIGQSGDWRYEAEGEGHNTPAETLRLTWGLRENED